jgi:hypothetical protein
MNAVKERVEARFGFGTIEAPNQALVITARRAAS